MEYKKLFIGGDLSGIQKFLYNISSKAAAVSLKGRSCYLQEYMDCVCKDLCSTIKTAGASVVKVRYCSGGKFYITTENTSPILSAIEEYSSLAQKDLWEKHMGKLGLSFATIPYNEHEDGKVDTLSGESQDPNQLWNLANKQFSFKKGQKFKSLILSDYPSFFSPIHVGGTPKVCAVTGIESPDCVPFEINNTDGSDNEQVFILPSVKEQIILGRQKRSCEGFKTFEEYANGTYLGVLRMDIDGLGTRLSAGFKSIDDYEVFSRRIDNFIKEDIKAIQQRIDFKEFLNIIYAGGDDLFVVGRWDKCIDFAECIHEEVDKLFASEGLTMSGGIAIVKPKFPIAKAAEIAGEAESLAKQFRNGEKNAFHLLGKTISWNEEFKKVKEYRNEFYRLIQDKGMSKSLLHKIMLYASISDNNKQKERRGIPQDFRYIWHMSYFLTRFMNRYNKEKDKDIRNFCKCLRDKEVTNDRNLELLSVAARWAELLIKYDISIEV